MTINQNQQQIRAAIQQAHRAMQLGEHDQCVQACDELLRQQPGLLTARQLRGMAALQAGRIDAAIEDLSAVLKQQSGNVHARLSLGNAYRQFGRHELCLDTLQPLTGNQNVDSRLRLQAEVTSARAATQLKSRKRAERHYRAAIQLKPDYASGWSGLASVLEKLNDLEAAREAAERALELAPQQDLARLVLATIDRRDGRPEAAMKSLAALAADARASNHRYLAGLQLARCHAALDQYTQAWRALQTANEVMITAHGQPETIVGKQQDYSLDTLAALGTASRQTRQPSTDEYATPGMAAEPVFFLGFPRSGTTLMDQMLSAHPGIEVIEERELLLPSRETLRDFGSPSDWLALDNQQLEPARQAYLTAAGHWRQRDNSLLIDKQPLNAAYLPLIQRLFPRARILLAIRDPRDVVLSCLFQPFELVGAMPYFLQPETSVRCYETVMTTVLESQPGFRNWHSYRYEDLIDNQESVLRKILEFLDLPWDQQVLQHDSLAQDRNIATPSYANVIKPVYNHAVGRWRHYAEPLQPWLPTLSEWAGKLGYQAG